MRTRFQLLRILLQIMFIALGLASCGKSTSIPNDMENLKALEASFERSGVDIQRGGKIPADLFGIEGQILFLDSSEIEVYEFPSKRERETISRLVTAEGMEVEGAAILWEIKPAIWGSGSLIVVYRGYDGGVFLLLSGLMGDPLTYEAPAEDEPFPPSVVSAIRHLADDLQVDPAQIQVLDFTEVTWPDTCLGAPRLEEECIQIHTTGWRVMMKVSGTVYEIRTDRLGEQIRQK